MNASLWQSHTSSPSADHCSKTPHWRLDHKKSSLLLKKKKSSKWLLINFWWYRCYNINKTAKRKGISALTTEGSWTIADKPHKGTNYKTFGKENLHQSNSSRRGRDKRGIAGKKHKVEKNYKQTKETPQKYPQCSVSQLIFFHIFITQ